LNYNHYLLKEKDFLQGSIVREIAPGFKVRVSNVLGQTFMPQHYENPFVALEKVIALDNQESFHIVDFHAEATAEKIALALFFDGKLGCVYGTHTHVQTADNRLLEGGTAFITDVGMTGPYYSVIGASKKIIMKRLREGLPIKIEQASGAYQFSGVILTVDINLKRTIS
jgi:metallophosphoesterase (TIGR00282 family)